MTLHATAPALNLVHETDFEHLETAPGVVFGRLPVPPAPPPAALALEFSGRGAWASITPEGAVDHGSLEMPIHLPEHAVIDALQEDLELLIKRHRPSTLITTTSALLPGNPRLSWGMTATVHVLAAEARVRVTELSPRFVRRRLVGHEGADMAELGAVLRGKARPWTTPEEAAALALVLAY